ncbi:hypothetical protein RFI_33923, partial [Reticulomyxa filosa]
EYIKIENKSPDYDEKILKMDNKRKRKIINKRIKDGSIRRKEYDTIYIYRSRRNSINPVTDQWEKDLHPYKPVIRDGKLYGRGSADDGYSIFAAIDSIASHPRCIITIEGSEESGPPHLYHYLKNKIGEHSLVICLNSGSGNYEQLCDNNISLGVDRDRFDDNITGKCKINELNSKIPDNNI